MWVGEKTKSRMTLKFSGLRSWKNELSLVRRNLQKNRFGREWEDRK